MRFVSAVRQGALYAVVGLAAGACGGQVSEGSRGDASRGLDSAGSPSGDSGGGGGGGGGGNESCAALADCCGGFIGSMAASCEAVADMGDDQACSNQVDVYRSQGFCE